MSDPKYDVFLSFRGEDTRNNFTSHLHKELCGKNIKTFIDDGLERGDEISQALYKAIEESTIYVIILSKHYASSSWCLDELTEILKCKERRGREVIPVFYKVDPSNVRHQRHSYEEDLVKHHQRFGDKVDAWKAALTQVAGLSGWDSQITSPESILVEKIAEDILKKLNRHVSSGYYEGLTGMDKHIEKIHSLMQLELPTVRMIGIWGMGGIGKSTIANAIFEKFETQFNSRCCIVPDVQQQIEKTDVEHVKNKYLSKLLNEDIKSSESNSSIVRKLKRAKVLLVFDDVKDFDQLQNLNGTHDNFIEGSRIIVTSRDKQVLENANVDEIYHVSEMDYKDSLQLFCLFAFKQKQPIESYLSLAEKVLDYVQGLPLALKVLGSMLYGKPKEVWETTKELPSSFDRLERLGELSLRGCTKLKTIPSSIGNLSKLFELNLTDCESLETFPSGIFKLKLTRLDFYGCPMLGSFPEIPNEFGRLSSLIELSLQGSSIVNLPESIAHLSSLRSLNLSDCKLLERVPKLPPNLNEVLAFDCRSIKRMMLNSGSASNEDIFEFYLTNSEEVDATSLSNIEKEAYIKINNDAYWWVLFCFPGSAVPDWFPHRCQGHSITIRSNDLYLYERNRLIGFALCVVLGRDFPYDIFWFDISFAYALKFESDGQTQFHPNKLEVKYDLKEMRSFVQDHTLLWKYKLDLARIGNGLIDAHTITFQILDEHGSPLSFPTTSTVKECGICPLYTKQNDDDDDDDEGNNEEPSGDAVCFLDLDVSLGGNYGGINGNDFIG
ncbi:hypothetical protein TSUD_81490 [Trifolium subterraneum]|uniref:ADP-ribosyl cyclase/cyclic ADP-ribose hydrolase n=1 Tax=Trifolium subterraneum TaxID=3900 RepID=A0A2Z6PE16_TRISU|nr:hypothetical protein TSUD_81490 [Trifolium subterraneum]